MMPKPEARATWHRFFKENHMSSDRVRHTGVSQYLDKKGKWRWTITAPNGKTIGAASQGYLRKVDCSTNMHRVAEALSVPIRWKS